MILRVGAAAGLRHSRAPGAGGRCPGEDGVRGKSKVGESQVVQAGLARGQAGGAGTKLAEQCSALRSGCRGLAEAEADGVR